MSEEKLSRDRSCSQCGKAWYFSERWETRLKELFGDSYKEPRKCQECRQDKTQEFKP
jgi:hypothetical protein